MEHYYIPAVDNVSTIEEVCAVILTMVLAVVLAIGVGVLMSEKNERITMTVAISTLIATLAAGFIFFILPSSRTDIDQSKAIAEQRSQIGPAYDLSGINLTNTKGSLCTDTSTVATSQDITWNGGHGTLVVGAVRDGKCQIDIFDESDRRLTPKN